MKDRRGRDGKERGTEGGRGFGDLGGKGLGELGSEGRRGEGNVKVEGMERGVDVEVVEGLRGGGGKGIGRESADEAEVGEGFLSQ
uniref:Uncharacterized protein n=1 Tax=Fagus sylvatica TaxID=28930 RepID=A0A2N9GDG7_FAGSY